MIGSKKRRRDRADATYWIAKLRSGPLSDSDRRRFECWRAAHPSHHAAVEDVLRERREALKSPSAAHQAPRSETERQRRHRSLFLRLLRWRPLRYLGIGAVALSAGLLLTMEGRADLQTEPGGQASFALADGSVVLMNTDTAIDMAADDARRLELLRGEADISVAGDKKPMRIGVANLLLKAEQGRFLLRREGRNIALAVIDGEVEVLPGDTGFSTRLSAGDYVLMSEDGTAVLPAGLAVEDAAAWQQGAVVFDGTPLDVALADISRYRGSRLLVLNASFAGRQVLGRFSIRDPDALMARLLRENGAGKLELFGLYTLVY